MVFKRRHVTIRLALFFLAAYFISSCTTTREGEKKFLLVFNRESIKNYPGNKPFVYNNSVNVEGSVNKDEQKRLTNDLANYWDDSMHAPRLQKFGIFFTIKNPPAFDTVNLARTKVFMTGYLNSQGYYTPFFKNIDSSYSFDTVRRDDKSPQIRTSIALNIDPGKPTIIDSLTYRFQNSFLDSIAIINSKNSFIKPKKTPFSKQNIATELDRLVNLYRQQGYFLLTRDNLVAEVDTSIISPDILTTDPFEQARIIAEAEQRRKQNPTCSVVLQKRFNADSLLAQNDTIYFKRYYTGNIYYYPETRRFDQPDTLMLDTTAFQKYKQGNMTMLYRKGTFKFSVLRQHTFQQSGFFYNEDNFYKTLNNLNQIGAWERIDYRSSIRDDSVDFYYFLTPAKPQTVSLNLEASHSSGDFLTTSNLIGFAFNISYLNRNLFRSAVQSNTTLSNGVEFGFNNEGGSFLQTVSSSLTQSFSFPRLYYFSGKMAKADAARSNVVFNGTYYDRKDFYRLRSLVSSYGEVWRQKNLIWQVKFPNVELYFLDTLPGLDSAFKDNPYLRTSFNTGTILGGQLGLTYTRPSRKNKNVTNYIRGGLEISSALGIKSLEDNVYQFIKIEGEYRRLYTFPKSSVALRALAGVGYNYHYTQKYGNTLPFYKQFIAGGPNSMRAWGLRLLGLGSSLVSDTATDFRDRYGDMQIETNIEYRFNLAQFSSVKIGSALFVDMGNIWNIHKNDSVPNSEFNINRLWQDWAIGVGTGLRFDFSYFLIRLDFGIKLKDPARYQVHNGWLVPFTWKNYLYSVKGPNGEYSPAPRNNYALQLGIGLPF